MDDNQSDSDDCCDYELPLSSISDLLFLPNSGKIVNNVQKSNKKQNVADDLTTRYECDICGQVCFKRSLIITHFRTSLCYPKYSFYLENGCSKYYSFSNKDNSRLYNNNIDYLESNNLKEMYNYRSSPEVEIMKVIKNGQTSFSNNNNLNGKVRSNAKSESTNCSCEPCKVYRKSYNKLYVLKDHQDFKPMSVELNYNVRNKSFKDLDILENRKFFHRKLSVPKYISKSHNLNKNYICSRCSKAFHKRSEIKLHIFDNHQEDYFKYSCDTCANLYHPQELILHLNKNLFKCDVCPKTYSTSYRLHQHYRWHLGINKFTCQYCPKIFSKCSSYLLHERTHTEETPFRCNLCNKWFPVTSNINIHFAPDHKPFVCDICQKVFAKMSSLQSHKIIHTENKQLKNTYNNNLTVQSINLKVQTRSHASREQYQCNVCHKSFVQLSTLHSHITTHPIEDLYVNDYTLNQFKRAYVTDHDFLKCDLCQEICSDLDIFFKHRCTLCKCKFCPKVLSNTFSLKRHYLNVHKINKPFECTLCKKLFKQTISFNRHKKMHFQFRKKRNPRK